jgi:hypothetical protein
MRHASIGNTYWRGHDDIMQIRSFWGSGEPVWVNALLLSARDCLGPDPRRALGRPHLPHQQAGHVTAPDQCCRKSQKVLAMAPSTRDPKLQ